MSWWGKIIGGYFGFVLGGPIGALLGAALGHNFDKGLQGFSSTGPGIDNQQRSQAAFFTATFSVMGHLCKADGRVTRDEINTARMIMEQMNLVQVQKKAAIALFNEGKKKDFPLEDVLLQLKHELGPSRNIKRMFIEIQCLAAYADGAMHAQEKKLLIRICKIIGFSQYEFESIAASVAAQYHHQSSGSAGKPQKMGLQDACKILNITTSANDAEVKKAYRRLMSQHHPDKLVSKGLPEEMIKLANERTQEIREAYERIMDERNK